MKIQKDRPKDQTNESKVTRKRRTFWDDTAVGEKLDLIPEGERGVVIRMALRSYFNIQLNAPDRLREIFLQVTERSGCQ